MKKCTVDDCGRGMHARGLCSTHYSRVQRRRGLASLPSHAREPRQTDMQHLESRSILHDNGCKVWNGSKTGAGYGNVWSVDRMVYTHRLAWELTYGLIPEGMVIDHKCRNRACINVDHMHVVTRKQNQENRVADKGSRSGVRNVHFHKNRPGKPWSVAVRNKGKSHHFGYFETVAEAEAVAIDARGNLFTNSLADWWKPEVDDA